MRLAQQADADAKAEDADAAAGTQTAAESPRNDGDSEGQEDGMHIEDEGDEEGEPPQPLPAEVSRDVYLASAHAASRKTFERIFLGILLRFKFRIKIYI